MSFQIRLLLLLFLLGEALSFGQGDDFVRGMLLDSKSGAPVVFATIRLKEKAVGVISNQDGSFRLPRRFMNLGETLTISCLGYENRHIMLSELPLDTAVTIKLDSRPIELEEAILTGKRRRLTPRQIIKKAIDRIDQNYLVSPFSYVGYYRDYQLKDNEYVNLNEALLQINDMGFQQNDLDHTKIRLYDYRANSDFQRDSLANSPYDYVTKGKIIKNAYLPGFGGNELNILRIHDAIRNYNIKTYSYINQLNRDLIRNHSLSRKGDRIIDNERIYVIGLEKSRPELDPDISPGEEVHADFRSEGTIYISQSSYAIHKLVYKMFDTNIQERSKQDIAKGKDKLIFEVTVEYMKKEGKMYPNYISFHNVFKLQKSLFKILDIRMNKDEKCFVVKFNKAPILMIDENRKNFMVKYRKKRIRLIETRAVFDEFHLYPEPEKFDCVFKESTAESRGAGYFSPENFEFNFIGVQDAQGNALNDFEYEEFDQYREFFTQQIQLSLVEDIPEKVLMQKNRPIFDNQPLTRPDNFDEYWMNTPLKKNQ